MGIKTWAVTSNVLRRLSRDQSKPRETNSDQNHGFAVSTGDSLGKARAAVRRKVEKLPLAVQILDDPDSVDQQPSCPLFAKLPAELRELIWDYALTAYEDLDALYPLDKPYARPGQAAPLRIALDLLFTCRAVYLEAFLVPFQVNPMVVFDGHPDVVPPHNPLQCTPSNLRLCRKLRPWQFANISSVDMSVQQFMLEGGSIERVSRLSGNKGRHEGHEARGFTLAGYASFAPTKEMNTLAGDILLRPRVALIRSIFMGKKITHLTLRMSRTDWWAWTSCPQAGADDPHDALRLEPMINVTDRRETSSAMLEGYEARKEGRQPDFNLDEFEKQGRWGMQFAEYWPDIQTLELVLETYAMKENQLDFVMKCAKLWTFPLSDGKQLEWNGKEESDVRWCGAREYGYDDELGMSWPNDRQDTHRSRSKDAPFVQWRPTTNDQTGADSGQEFVMKSLVFTRRRSVDATVSLDA
ncbi:hypothetical protein GQX73_g6165 [Xylaria multiplex]|uniref:F-box domain-containing protein n=1 Tax=Xylaria multiplex TaxID=323545 RepID=A0A7C8MKV7_9PEZI|nr:hypothetical protein GQX73_g6165 [Xylaria multiplex]